MQPFDLGSATWTFGTNCTGVGIQITETQANSVTEEILMIDFSDYRSITTIKNLDFGSFTPGNGSITVNPNGNYIATNIVYHDGGVQPAEFEVGGFENTSFVISLPTSVIVSYNDLDTMTVNNFTTNLTNNEGVIGNGNYTKNFFVGADLIVSSDQLSGQYTGYFVVTADFY